MRASIHTRGFVRYSLSWLLAFSLLFPPGVFANQAHATTTTQSVSESNDKLEMQKDGAFLEEALLGNLNRHSLDTFRVLAQEAIDLPKAHLIDLNAMSVDVVDENGKVIKSLSQLKDESFVNQGIYKYYFQLSYQGKSFLKFKAPIKAVAFQNNKVIFLEEGTDTESTTELQFIDLKAYKIAIGKTALPVFRLPADKGSVDFNRIYKLKEALDLYSEVQQMVFNLSVSLVDIPTLEAAEPLLNDIQNYIDKAIELKGASIESQDVASQRALHHLGILSGDINKQFKNIIDTKSAAKDAETIAQGLKREFAQDRLGQISEISNAIITERTNQRKLFARIKTLRAAFVTPQPLGTPKIAKALAFTASGLNGGGKYDLQQALRHFSANKSVRMGLAISSGLALGTLYPSEAAAFMYGSLDVARTAYDVVFGRIAGLGTLAGDAIKATFSGFNPITFSDAYFSPDKLHRLGVGLTALFTTIYLAIGVPHIMANSYYLIRDLGKINWGEKIKKEGGLWSALKDAFIRRQNKVQKDYLAALAKDARQGNERQYSAEEDAEIASIIAGLEKGAEGGVFSRWMSKLFQRKAPKATSDISKFGEALRHFFFSYATFTISGKAYTSIWNSWFGIRSFIWSPKIFAATLMYPNIWNRAVNGNLPSKYNGGLRTRVTSARQFLFNRTQLSQLNAVEDQLALVEKKISQQVLRESFVALADYAKNMKELQSAYNYSRVGKISSADLDQLTHKHRTFFRSYYEEAMNQAMAKYLENKGLAGEFLSGDVSKLESVNFTINDSEAQSLVASLDKAGLSVTAKSKAESPLQYKAAITNLKASIVSQLDETRNMQVKRMRSVQRQAEKPQAMARAVRSMIASNVVDKPLELMFTFACLAGITSGVLMPIQEDMHSENSWFYLSRMVFSNGFIYGVISGVFADIWMKLQQDELHEGQFDKVPEGADAEGSFLKYYSKQAFKNPENSLWRNQMHNWKIVWANMKAAFTTMLAVNLVTLGRLDLDAYIVGYLFVFMTPLSGFAFKLEQGFELAANYFAKDIPEKYRSHPRAQEYLNKVIGKKRLKFNFLYKTYENIMGYLVFNFQQMSTLAFGSRSFSRVLLGGYTWTELAVGGLNKLSDSVAKVPGASKLVDACSYLLSNNYTDFEKIKPKK